MAVQEAARGLQNLTYDDLVSWSNLLSDNKVDSYISAINSAGYDVSEMQAVEDFASGYMDFYANADGTYTVTQFKGDYQNVVTNPIDSNVSTVSRGGISQMLNRGKDAVTGKLNITKFPIDGSFASQASYVLGSVGGAVAAVSSGIALGKVISPLIYEANPNFWESIGVTQGNFNPETWNTITNCDDSNFAGLFNLIMGLDPQTGNSQAYMDETAFAYMALAMKEAGIFAETGKYVPSAPSGITLPNGLEYPLYLSGSFVYLRDGNRDRYWYTSCNSSDANIAIFYNTTTKYCNSCAISKEPFKLGRNLKFEWPPQDLPVVSYDYNAVHTTVNGQDIYYYPMGGSYFYDGSVPLDATNGNVINYSNSATIFSPETQNDRNLVYVLLYDSVESGGIEGISNQPNATLPDTSTWTDIPSTLQSLKQQYPDMWNDALTWDNVQPDGSNPQLTYIPVPMPQATSGTDTQPVTGTQTQTQTVISPTDTDQTLLDLITQLITKTQTDTDTSIPPNNPVDTGTGGSPVPTPPSGSASALWSVYHPTQAQVNSFGAWLWGSPFLTNIGKLFQNPIDGVISLHKIFAMPVDSGTGNIVVGTLDSGVSSATVNQQYVTVDCGSISCMEDFGNVFDYSPFTSASIYLPFIGIVPIDVNDIMRSTIHVTYGVDVYTGACLAMIEVTRDSFTVNMYQYAGVASVEYPLSNVQNGQLVSGLLAIGAGVASMVATGGVTAPAVGAVAGGMAAGAKSNVGKSGGFSGNAGAMGIKKPYLILQRPQTKVAETFTEIEGYPTNYSCKLGDCSGQVVVKSVHVEGIPATDAELTQIESLLKDGVLV